MFVSAASAGPSVGSSPGPSKNTLIARELNSAAMDGDDKRVKELLEQLLLCPNRPVEDRLPVQVAALKNLFYAMRNMAITDELTGVYNRRGFDWVGSHLLRHLCRERRGALLMYVDVDNLKIINDTLGHTAGDRLLVATSQALRAACGESAVIGRIGGDEFALLARSGADGYAQLRRRIHSAVADCNASADLPPLSLSLGVAEFDPLRPASVLTLLDRADRAMYLEKFRKAQSSTATAPMTLVASSG